MRTRVDLVRLFPRFSRKQTQDQLTQDCQALRDALVLAIEEIETLTARVQALEDGA